MLDAAQIRAARALIGWNQADLARHADVGIATIRRIEGSRDALSGYLSTAVKIQNAFEKAGVMFLSADISGGRGVRLAPDNVQRSDKKR